jgi:hypothetical protein
MDDPVRGAINVGENMIGVIHNIAPFIVPQVGAVDLRAAGIPDQKLAGGLGKTTIGAEFSSPSSPAVGHSAKVSGMRVRQAASRYIIRSNIFFGFTVSSSFCKCKIYHKMRK